MTRLFLILLIFPFSFFVGQESVQQALKLADAKDFDGARKMLEAVTGRNDTDSEAHFQLGKLLLDHYRDLDAAEEHLERAVELDDHRAACHFTLGRAYGAIAQNGSVFTGMKYAGKVKSEFLRAVELEPTNIVYRTGLLRYYLQAPAIAGGSISKAREQADVMLQLDAYEGHMAFAQIAKNQKDDEAAQTEYKAAIAANPGKPEAHFRLGYHYLGQRRIDEAITQFREYVRCAPDDPNSHDSLGEALVERAQYDEALQEYGRALALNPRFASSLFGTARCYEGKGMRAEALAYYKQYLTLEPEGDTAKKAKQKVEELQ